MATIKITFFGLRAKYFRLFALLVLFLSFNSALAQLDDPKHYDGFVYPTKGHHPVQWGMSNIQWEMFLDPMCPFSKESWPIIKQVMHLYNATTLGLIVHPFSVPFHHNSFFGARALHITRELNNSLLFPLLDLIFEKQDSFNNINTDEETPASVKKRYAALAGDLGMSAYEFELQYFNYSTNHPTRVSFKYGSSRGVIQTPSFLVNGVLVNGADAGWNVSDWTTHFAKVMKDPF